MKVIIVNVDSSIEARWSCPDEDTLVIRLSTDLDEIARQRYIAQAKAENGIEEHRRRTLIPLLPFFGRHGSGHSTSTTAIAVGSGVVAAGVAAAAIIPAALDSNQGQVTRRPSAAGPAPTRGMPPNHGQPPVRPPSDPPHRAQPPTSPAAPDEPLVPRHLVRTALEPTPIRSVTGIKKPLPRLPLPPLKRSPGPVKLRKQSALLKVSLPGARVRVSVRPRLSVQVRFDLLQPRPDSRP